MIILFWHGDSAIQVSNTNVLTLPVDCQVAGMEWRQDDKYRAGDISKIDRPLFKSIFGEK